MAIVLRSVKGQALTKEEQEGNIVDLDERPLGQVYPKSQSIGIKIDTATPDWGWHDLLSTIRLGGTANDPTYVTYQGSIKQAQFDVGDEIFTEFHMPHDYAMGTDIYIHAHWSHNALGLTTGGITGVMEASYAKGHDQDFFGTPIIVNLAQDASLVRYQHLIAEGPLSAAGGAGGLIDTALLEPDGLFLVRVELTGNTMDAAAKPFLHAVDIHYQSTGLATKQKAPDFWT